MLLDKLVIPLVPKVHPQTSGSTATCELVRNAESWAPSRTHRHSGRGPATCVLTSPPGMVMLTKVLEPSICSKSVCHSGRNSSNKNKVTLCVKENQHEEDMCQWNGTDMTSGRGSFWGQLDIKKNKKLPRNLPSFAQAFSHNCHSTHIQYEKERNSSNLVAQS